MVALTALAGGCNRTTHLAAEVVYAPDGQTVAWLWQVAKLYGRFEEYHNYGDKLETVSWQWAGHPASVQTEQIRSAQRMPAFLAEWKTHDLSIAPDSKHLTFILRDRVRIMSMEDGTMWTLSERDETATSVRWASPTEVVYMAVRKVKKDKTYHWRKTIWRHRIFAVEERKARTEVYSTINRTNDTIFKEFWSPNRRYALLIEPVTMRIIDVETGNVNAAIRKRSGINRGVCWHPESTKVFTVFGWGEDQEGPEGAALIDARTNEVTDYSGHFREFFGTNPFRAWDWTVDGKYIITFDMRMLYVHLVQLEPWYPIRFEAKYEKKIPKEFGDIKVMRSLAPGWIWVRPNREGPTYAMDYRGEYVIPIATHNWAVSPDYERIAEVIDRVTLDIKPLDLPPTRPLPTEPPEDITVQPEWLGPQTQPGAPGELERQRRQPPQTQPAPRPSPAPFEQPPLPATRPVEPVEPTSPEPLVNRSEPSHAA